MMNVRAQQWEEQQDNLRWLYLYEWLGWWICYECRRIAPPTACDHWDKLPVILYERRAWCHALDRPTREMCVMFYDPELVQKVGPIYQVGSALAARDPSA